MGDEWQLDELNVGHRDDRDGKRDLKRCQRRAVVQLGHDCGRKLGQCEAAVRFNVGRNFRHCVSGLRCREDGFGRRDNRVW